MTAPNAPPPQERRFLPGHRIGSRYIIDAVLGEGASGIVYLAHRDQTDERVALKVIHRHLCGDRQIFQRFHREAKILEHLDAPNIAKLLEFIEEDGLLIIALEYVEGPSLDAFLEKHSPLAIDTALTIALQVCSALEVAHRAGVVHRDLKPANVVIGQGGDGALHVWVVDFGLAKVIHGEHMNTGLTEQDMIFGTPEYMAPEQAQGDDVDPRCDIYALGIMLYEMVVGAVPFKKRTPIASMTAHLAEVPASPRSKNPEANISIGLETVILRALEKKPADRYPSAEVLAEALKGCLTKPQVVTPSASNKAMKDPEFSKSLIEHSPTMPGELPNSPMSTQTMKEIAFAETLPVNPGASSDLVAQVKATKPKASKGRVKPKPTGFRREHWLWILVAVVFAVIGVIIGTLFGTR